MFKVMIADDNPNIIEELNEIVDWEDFSSEIVYTCANGELLLQEALHNPPDIILSDISMPCMGGLELSTQIRELLPNTKIILISCFSDFEYARKAIDLGISGYIVKPIQKDNLIQVMNRVIQTLTNEKLTRTALAHKDQLLAIAQQGVLRQLLREVGSSQVNKKLSVLGIRVPTDPIITIAYIRLLEDFPEEEAIGKMRLVFALIEQNLLTRRDSWIVQPNNCDIALIYMTSSQEKGFLIDLITQLCIETESQLGLKLKVGVSNNADKLSDIPSLYEQAYTASRKCYGIYQAITPYMEVSGLVDLKELSDASLDNIRKISNFAQGKSATKEQNRNQRISEEIMQFVNHHYMESITTTDIAKAVFLSPSYANTLFKKATNMTIFDYLISCRIQQAKILLQNTTKSVTDIAEIVGYSSKANFYLAFKRMTNMSPTEYRSSVWK